MREKVKNRDQLSDEDLMFEFQNGNNYAFDILVKRYKDQLVNFAYRFLGSRIDAEDVVQETFLRVYKKKSAYKRIAKFSTWIYTITGNLAKTELRRRKRRKIFSLSNMTQDDKDFDIPDVERGPESTTDDAIREKIIENAIRSLPKKFKEMIILRDIQELSYEEISNIANIPLGTVKSRINRGRLKLQEILEEFKDELGI